ncbi:hypothetical protein D3C86_1809830 [compost metagenome]
MAETRPRMASGVKCWSIVERITMLTMSNAPTRKSKPQETAGLSERPNPMVATPNPATTPSRIGPFLRRGGRCVSSKPMANAPSDGAAMSQPSP